MEKSSPQLKPRVSHSLTKVPLVEVEFRTKARPVRVHLVPSDQSLQLSANEAGETVIDIRLLWVRAHKRANGWRRTTPLVAANSQEIVHSANAMTLASAGSEVTMRREAHRVILQSRINSRPVTEAELFLALRHQMTSAEVGATITDLLRTGQIVRAIGHERRFGGQLIRAYRTR